MKMHNLKTVIATFAVPFAICATQTALTGEEPSSIQMPKEIPAGWQLKDIADGKKFMFLHKYRDSKSFAARTAADKQSGFLAPDVIQIHNADLTNLKGTENIKPGIEGRPRILGEPAVSRHGGYKDKSIEESQKLIPDIKSYEAFKKGLGGAFIGVMVGEWMDHAIKGAPKKGCPQDNTFNLPAPPTSKAEAVKRLEQFYRKGIANLAYGDIISLEGYRLFHHQAFEWGAAACMVEIGENIPATQTQIAFGRGAARQYGKPWGVWVADCAYQAGERGMSHRYYHTTARSYGPGKEHEPSIYGPTMGHTESLERRFQYVSFMSGSNFNNIEGVGIGAYYKDDNSDGVLELSPWGDLAKEMIDFGRKHGTDRGVTMTPVGVVVEWAHGWSPSGCTPHKIWGYIPFNDCDRMMDELFNTLFPWNPKRQFDKLSGQPERAYLANNEFGDIFDVLADNAKTETLANYPILLLAGDAQVKGDFERRLWKYVNDGGTLVANIEQMGGAEMKWKPETDGCFKDGDTTCKKAILKDGATAALSTSDGQALIVRQSIGKGALYVTMTPWLLNGEGHMTESFKPFLKDLTRDLLPFKIEGSAEVIYNRNATGWVLTLVNNDGVSKKSKDDPGTIDYSKKSTLRIAYSGKPLEIREWLADRSICWSQKDGTALLQDIELLPGEFKIIEIRDQKQKDDKEPKMSKIDLTPFLARGFGEQQDKFIANIPVEGIDKYHTWTQVRLAPESAEHLYAPPAKVKYFKGSRPRLEKIVENVLAKAGKTDMEKMLALLDWTAKTVKHAKYIKGPVPGDRALSEEELIDSGWGWCNEKARIFVTLAQIAGYPARMCSLYHSNGVNGHMTSEVFIDGKWVFTDPTSATVIQKPDGSLASAKELSWDAGLRDVIDKTYAKNIRAMDKLHGADVGDTESIWYKDNPYKMFTQIGLSSYPVITFPK